MCLFLRIRNVRLGIIVKGILAVFFIDYKSMLDMVRASLRSKAIDPIGFAPSEDFAIE